MTELFVVKDCTVKEALKKIDKSARKILIVVGSANVLLGTLTDGDIRRHILRGAGLDSTIAEAFNPDPVFLFLPWELAAVREMMIKRKIEAIPVVNGRKEVVEVLFWSDVFGDEPQVSRKERLRVPLVIMAGGKGTRLDPFTRILPKPLIPIGEKPIIEVIIDKFASFGVDTFYVSVNYKGDMIKSYFDYQENRPAKLHFLNEKDFLGTAGSLKLLPENIESPFILTNCDIIVDADYFDVVGYHKKNENILTVIGSIQHYKIPYGIIQFNSGGIVDRILEKPEYDFTVNTGIYVLEKAALVHIPEGKPYNVTDLINDLLRNGERVGVYPVSEKSYVDLGQLEEYKKTLKTLGD